jgi:hypothetical protein
MKMEPGKTVLKRVKTKVVRETRKMRWKLSQ